MKYEMSVGYKLYTPDVRTKKCDWEYFLNPCCEKLVSEVRNCCGLNISRRGSGDLKTFPADSKSDSGLY